MKILVLVAHPDDEVLGCGGTIAALAKNKINQVVSCIVSEGASAQYRDPKFIEIRKNSALAAAKVLGIKRTKFLMLPDQKLDSIPQLEINRAVERIIDEERPEIVYTHSPHDINKDHRLVFESTMVACRPYRRSIRQLVCYEIPGSHLSHFEPNMYSDITSTIALKLKAFKEYNTEIEDYPKPRSPESIKAWASVRGIESGVRYAEAFKLIREISKVSR